ncbi:MAG: ABC transporter permease [Silvibacterium sp.]|nr:ABC transporter permease [Silvibacterium sp.]MBV8437786.1 ABC transporter permease [Silvibacterium sp.]
MSSFLWDFRYALRQLRKSPGFTLTAVFTLALGIGANAAIFSAVYRLLLQSLPFPESERVMNIFETHPQVTGGAEVTYPDYQDWKKQQRSFEQVAAYSTLNPDTVSLVSGNQSAQVHRVLASGNFFATFGTAPLIGRTFTEKDEAPGADHVAVLSAAAWQQYFGQDPGIVGRGIALNGSSYTVIGVLEPGAAFPATGEVWLPLSLLDQPTQTSRVWHSVNVIGRLHLGIGLAEAKADMQTIAARIAAAYPATNRNVGVRLTPLREQLVGTLRPAILSLMGSVVLVLLIACANVASLLMVRATASRHETAVRQALGADRIRLFSQYLVQALILCLMGGGLGIFFASMALPLLRLALAHTGGVDLLMVQSIRLNVPVLAFTLGTCMLTAIVFGLLPLLKTSSSLADSLRPGDRTSTGRRSIQKGVLIAGEIAVAVVVLFLSTLVIRSFQKLIAVDPGFRTDHLLSFEITLPGPRYQDGSPDTNRIFEQLLDKLSQSPGVLSAGSTTQVPLMPSRSMTRFLVEGAPPLAPGAFPMAQIRFVSPAYFRTIGLGLQQGRLFDQKDVNNPTGVFVVNQAFAERYLSGRNPVGANIVLGVLSPQPSKIPVIGVVANARDLGVQTDPWPEIYLPGYGVHEVLMVRTAQDPRSVVTAVRNAVHELAPNQPIYHIRTLDEVLSESWARQKMTATLLGIFSVIALSLAAVGIYGVLAYSIAQRTREIGVRMAVGARREDIVTMVLRQTAAFASAGIGAGLGIAFAGAHLLSSLLFKTSTTDPFAVSLTTCILVLIAALAATLPARRAASVDPGAALRAE